MCVQMAARAADPIWAAIMANPSLAGHRIQQQHMRCQTCSRDDEGEDKQGADFTAMHPDHVAQHLESVDHLRRVAEGRVMRGPMIVNGTIIIRHVVQCLHCSLTTQGYRRTKYCRMDGPTSLAHVGTVAHFRRVADGRRAQYDLLHPPGHPIRLPQDAW